MRYINQEIIIIIIIIIFSVLGTVGAFFVCTVVIVKYAEGAHAVRKEFIE